MVNEHKENLRCSSGERPKVCLSPLKVLPAEQLFAPAEQKQPRLIQDVHFIIYFLLFVKSSFILEKGKK